MYKTIVVHLSSATGTPRTLDIAAGLANSMGAHLIGATTSGIVELNYLLAAGAEGGSMLLPEDCERLHAEAQQRLQSFDKHCNECGVNSFETRMLDVSQADAMLLQSSYCDLLVADLEDVASHGLLMPAALPGTLVTRAARPVMLVPPLASPSAAFSNLLIAWNGSMGINRVIALALPLIARAAKVTIAVCNPEAEQIDAGGEPGADLAAYLARHNRNVEVVRRDTDEEADTALVNLAAETCADLMLAGAFGHTRLRQWVLGSTTRGLLRQTRIPLLMTH
ncbi:universal stress protein [Pseudoduganella ginsengisoli]|uniref:UspA domain-containing protein n=1 Tax=Pseudoduganella ginsengisoli TaxID=1462440 RepID=A0A6L6Q472_9BURK|nr:universal stress protein [Pseudoduganella ginsengisoli]MTW04617.1 hypothetical protein [Pseudoduganella ginsengisoli]